MKEWVKGVGTWQHEASCLTAATLAFHRRIDYCCDGQARRLPEQAVERKENEMESHRMGHRASAS